MEKNIWYIIPGSILIFPLAIFLHLNSLPLSGPIVALIVFAALPLGYLYHQGYRIYYTKFKDGYKQASRVSLDWLNREYTKTSQKKSATRENLLYAWIQHYHHEPKISDSFREHSGLHWYFIIANSAMADACMIASIFNAVNIFKFGIQTNRLYILIMLIILSIFFVVASLVLKKQVKSSMTHLVKMEIPAMKSTLKNLLKCLEDLESEEFDLNKIKDS